jgi:hypothetical protein
MQGVGASWPDGPARIARSGGVRNVTYRDSRLGAGPNSRGIDIKARRGPARSR